MGGYSGLANSLFGGYGGPAPPDAGAPSATGGIWGSTPQGMGGFGGGAAPRPTQGIGRAGNPFEIDERGYRTNSPDTRFDPSGEMWVSGKPFDAFLDPSGQVQTKDWQWYTENYPQLQRSRWEDEVDPALMHPTYGVTYGMSRAAMRNLGFDQNFGGGRGGAFQQEIGTPAVQDEINRMTEARRRGTQMTQLPGYGTPPDLASAYQPNFNMFWNPQAMVAAGQPFYGEPFYGNMAYPYGHYGASRFMSPQPKVDPPDNGIPGWPGAGGGAYGGGGSDRPPGFGWATDNTPPWAFDYPGYLDRWGS